MEAVEEGFAGVDEVLVCRVGRRMTGEEIVVVVEIFWDVVDSRRRGKTI